MNKLIRLAFALLCLAAFTACQQEEESIGGNRETTAIHLNIGGLTVDSKRAESRYVDAQPFEGLRTLRVIVCDRAQQKIYYNKKVNVISDPTSPTEAVTTQTLTIPDIPIGEVSFFVIANEESIGKTYDDATLGEDSKQGPKLLFIDESNPHFFPKRGPEIEQYGLPMSGTTSANISKENNTVPVSLERAVTKIALMIENTTTSTITLTAATFGKFFGDRLYVFAESNLDVPNDSQYSPLKYEGMSVEIAPNTSSDPLSLYLYPTYAYTTGMSESPYTLSMTTTAREYQAQVFAPGVNSFRRNTQVNIRARITTTVGMELDYAVQEWDNYTVDVPDFN